MTRKQTRTLVARDGAGLFVREWWPEGPPTGAILICHGLGEHSGRYDHVGEALVEAGLVAWAHDHRGHGQSTGARGALARPDDLVVDSEHVIAALKTETGLTPFVAGHSMGGPIAGMVALRSVQPVRGLILSSPALQTRASAALIGLGKALSVVAPNLALGNQLAVEYVARDPAVVDAYKADPLNHPKITPRLMAWIVGAGDALRAAAPAWKTDTLLMFAGEDRLVDPAGARAFAAAAPAGRVRATEYPSFYHEIFNDPEKARPLDEMKAWLAGRP